MEKSIRVLLVDDQRILLDGLQRIFAGVPDIDVVGTCSLGNLSGEAVRRFRPDCVLMDICMEGRTSGIDNCSKLKKLYPNLPIILMTGMTEVSFLQRGKAAGADSFIYKECSGEEFIDCIRQTMAGKHVYPEQKKTKGEFGYTDVTLTDRELEILRLICCNLTYEEIAQKLGITKRTVSFHVSNMLLKTGHKSIVGLAVEAAEKGYTGMETQLEQGKCGDLRP